MDAGKKRRGRPIKPPVEGERIPLSLRVTAKLKRDLEQASAGRSLSQEAERRLEMSFEWERAFGDAQSWLRKSKSEVNQVERGNTEAALRRLGWQRVMSPGGYIWVPPGAPTSAASELLNPGDEASSLQQIIERAVSAALAKAGMGEKQR